MGGHCDDNNLSMGGHCDDNNAVNPRSGIDSETPIPWENRARDQAAGGSSTRHTQELAEFYSSGGQRRDTHGISRQQYPLLYLLCCKTIHQFHNHGEGSY